MSSKLSIFSFMNNATNRPLERKVHSGDFGASRIYGVYGQFQDLFFDVTALFFDNAGAFMEMAHMQRFEEAEKEARKRRREIAQAEKRIAELDRIFKRIYEDDISGAISHERFLKLSAEYEAEQEELTKKVKADREMVSTYEQDREDFDNFAAVIRKYVRITELTPTIINEFVKKIIVHAPDKSSGHRRQKIQLVWNFIGEVNLPNDDQTIERQRKSKTA